MSKEDDDLKVIRKTWHEFENIPEWINDDYEWYIDIRGVKHYIVYIDLIHKSVELFNSKTQNQKTFTPRSKYWREVLEELTTTAPSKIY